MHNMKVWLVAISYLVIFSGCDHQDEPGSIPSNVTDNHELNTDQSPTTSAIDTANIKCDETTWKAYVALHKPGSIKTYEMKIKTTSSNMPATNVPSVPETVLTRTEEIVEASDAQVVTKKTANAQPATTATMTKAQFLKLCAQYQATGLPPQVQANYTILEQGEESKTVRAGIFACTYSKIKMEMSVQGVNSTTIAQTWVTYENTNLEGVLAPTTIYSVSSQSRQVQGITMVTQTVDELVSWKR